MLLIGTDYYPSFQQIAFLNQDTGECGELRLNHGDGEAERCYRDLKRTGVRVRVGLEATG
jgi:transposase